MKSRRLFLAFLAYFLPAVAFAMPRIATVSVDQCGADPTGKTDSTSAFQICLASTPAGNIVISPGEYRITGTIVKNRNQNLIGSGSSATVLECQSTTAPCIVVADTSGGPNDYTNSRIEDLTVQGPGVHNASIGIFLGGDPAGRFSTSDAFADSANLVDVRVTGFNHGVEWGNNAWVNKLVRCLIFGNDTGLYVPTGLSDSGENIGLTDTDVFNNGTFGLDDHGNFEWMLNGVSFDYNGTAIEFFGATIHALNSHFEQNGGQVFLQPYGDATLSIKDSEILVQANSGSDTYILSTWPQVLNLAIDDVSIWSNHPIQYFMRVQGSVVGAITNLHGNGNKMIHGLSSAPSQAVTTASSIF